MNFIEIERRRQFLLLSDYSCEGKDASNYTLLKTTSRDLTCSLQSFQDIDIDKLVRCGSNGQKEFESLQIIASSLYPAGG